MTYLRMKGKPGASHQPLAKAPAKAKRQRPNRKAQKLAKWGAGEMQRLTSPISSGFGSNVKPQRGFRS